MAVVKRTVQHGLFSPSSEGPNPTLKPGQTDLRRKDVFSVASRLLPETYITQDGMRASEYARQIHSRTLPEDYENPTRLMRPPEVTAGGPGGTAHWVSEYKAAAAEATSGAVGAPPLRLGAVNILARCRVGKTRNGSTYNFAYGKHGHDPRSLIVPGSTKLPVIRSELTYGTTKGTSHIPGYQGHIPVCPVSLESARAEQGHTARSLDKSDAIHSFHRNIVGYQGHEPESARNDKGRRMPTDLTVEGHMYKDPHVWLDS
mmetsp:Transcript_37671/g.82721  ORF Transcript_37671/g.82721 Transcript_37671/m.82721 type:complete len:259 (+) Transcript_37671:42-818(+)